MATSAPFQAGLVIVVVGPTAIGKTSVAIRLAEEYKTEILSADSRQFYRDLNIGVARPSEAELNRVKHHFIGFLDLDVEYSAGKFALESRDKIQQLLQKHHTVIVSGGSMMYVDAMLYGFDEVPAWPEIRKQLNRRQKAEGTESLFRELSELDSRYAGEVDRSNPHRIIRALEVCLGSGKPYSTWLTAERKEFPFRFALVGLQGERNWLYERINERVLSMFEQGLEEEARRLIPYRGLNALNTVGYKELFSYFDGECTLEDAVKKIQQHTRNYAKRQLTWWRNREDVIWFDADQGDPVPQITAYLEKMF